MITLDNLLYEAGEEDTAHKLEYMISRQPTAGMHNVTRLCAIFAFILNS